MLQTSDSAVYKLQAARPLSLKHACLKTISPVVGWEVFTRHLKGHSPWDLQSSDMRAVGTCTESTGEFQLFTKLLTVQDIVEHIFPTYPQKWWLRHSADFQQWLPLFSGFLFLSENGQWKMDGWWLWIISTPKNTQNPCCSVPHCQSFI